MVSPNDLGAKVVRTICDRCHCACGIMAHVKDGKVLKVEGDPDFPQNQGFMCPKGLAVTQFLYHPDRLLHPLKRTGERGDGKWQQITWDEALDIAAQKFRETMQKYGPRAVTWSWGDAAFHCSKVTKQAWLRAMGSPLRFHSDSHYCYHPMMIANNLTFGASITSETGPDYRNSKCIMVWGGNPVSSHPTRARDIMIGKKRGAKLIVVDPRFTEIASKADIYLQVRPGADDALALGMLNVIISEELYDKEFVSRWCTGFDALRKRVREYPVDRVAEITWVPKGEILAAARMYATLKPGSFHNRIGLQMNTNSIQTLRAAALLVAITGNVDVMGGNLLPNWPKGFKGLGDLLRDIRLPNEDEAIGAKEYPLLTGSKSLALDPSHPPSVVHAILTGKPYPVRAVWALNNLLLAMEDTAETRKALLSLDFFVGSDFFMTPTLELCDLILPPCTYLEREENEHLFYQNYVAARQKAIDELGETWNERRMDFEIIRRMGLELPNEFHDDREYNDYPLKGMGVNFEELKARRLIEEPIHYKKYEKSGFRTPSGKVELYSGILEKFGYDPLPHYEENPESPISTPEIAKEYPLILTGGRHVVYWHGMNVQLPWLREIVPEPVVEINPATAAELGIKDGDWVWIEGSKGRGRVRQKAVLTEAVHPRVVGAPSHWYYPERSVATGSLDANINQIFSNDPPYDPISGGTPIRESLCKVYKAEA